MINRAVFRLRCRQEGLTVHFAEFELVWRVPIEYMLWRNNSQVLILHNMPHCLVIEDRRRLAVAVFDNLDEAIATYNLLNP